MKKLYRILLLISPVFFWAAWILPLNGWFSEKHQGYQVYFTEKDSADLKIYAGITDKGIEQVKTFFGQSFKTDFDVFVHPNRSSLDSTWQKNWKMPEFKSQCWMVASGVSDRLDMIAPRSWDKDACEHLFAESEKTQQLITHELVHVFHGQHNKSPDFSDVEGIDWFVEGLATYASGQCDSLRLSEVKTAIAGNKVPASLDDFWSGKIKYGISGSMVMYIDKTYGREKLLKLLPFNKKADLLAELNLTEAKLLGDWKKYMQAL